jgi:hypothetical protein
MQRESHWDYMGRRMREERNYMYGKVSLTSMERELLSRVEELERKVSLLGGDPKQLELDV